MNESRSLKAKKETWGWKTHRNEGGGCRDLLQEQSMDCSSAGKKKQWLPYVLLFFFLSVVISSSKIFSFFFFAEISTAMHFENLKGVWGWTPVAHNSCSSFLLVSLFSDELKSPGFNFEMTSQATQWNVSLPGNTCDKWCRTKVSCLPSWVEIANEFVWLLAVVLVFEMRLCFAVR